MPASSPSLYTISKAVLVQYIEAQYNKRLLFSTHFLAVVLGLGRATALTVLTLTLQLFVVFWSALRSYRPAFPPKLDGGGILLLCQILGTNFTCLLCTNSQMERGLSPHVSDLFALSENLHHPDLSYGSNTSRINRYTRRSFSSLHASNAPSILFRRDRASESSPSSSTKSLTGTFSALANAMIVSKVGLLRPFSKALKYFASPRVRSATCSCVSPAASRIDFNLRPNAFA
jgi:hypothetical protein